MTDPAACSLNRIYLRGEQSGLIESVQTPDE
jgi:hypothetical protein